MKATGVRLGAAVVACAVVLVGSPAQALTMEWLDGEVSGVLNSSLTMGAAWRMQERSEALVGKGNNAPEACAHQYQSCQGLFKDQFYPAQQLARTPGQYSMRNDDGNLNYDRYDPVQAPLKVAQDLSLTWGDYGIFARWLYFYDFVNNRFREYHPNRITRENVDEVGYLDHPISNRYFTEKRVYGPGRVERSRRRDGEVLRQIGTDLQLLDLNFYGTLPIGDEKELTFKIGRQVVNWGESTLLVLNSINQAQPVNANNLFRTGMAVEEVFTPVGMVFASIEPFENTTLEAYYQYEWKPVESPAPGGYFAFADLGSYNAGDDPNLSFGNFAEDPDRAYRGDTANTQRGYGDNPLTLITPIGGTVERLRDRDARDDGQYGVALKYYAEWLNNGTELGFYFMNYHSKLPIVSFYSINASCARAEGNALGINAYNTATLIQACPNMPVFTEESARRQLQADTVDLFRRTAANNPQDLIPLLIEMGVSPDSLPAILQDPRNLGALMVGGDPNSSLYRDVVPLDTGKIVFEYPEDLKLFGVSFNTTWGDYSFQGEVAYRPDQPLQVSIADLSFAAAGPALTRCHRPDVGPNGESCAGSTTGVGWDENGNRVLYGSSDAGAGYPDTINILLGHAPGSARAFPNFIIPYRGGVTGENAPNSYIRGWEEFDTYQFNLGSTRVLGATDNPLGADQIQIVSEFGATWVPGLPDLDTLQLDAPGVFTGATAGADGSGADGSRQACGPGNPTCVTGPDGTRFNPHQADLEDFVDRFSWGYRAIAIFKYESVLPGISLQPVLIWAHDVRGTAPGPGENFVQGRKSAVLNLETRYLEALSFTVGYAWFTGGGDNNLYRDRDFLQAFVRYQF